MKHIEETPPHVQAESYWSDLQQLRIKVLKSVTCNECDHCRAWLAMAGSGTVPVGFCMRNELPLNAQDLRTSQWDMCGDELLEA